MVTRSVIEEFGSKYLKSLEELKNKPIFFIHYACSDFREDLITITCISVYNPKDDYRKTFSMQSYNNEEKLLKDFFNFLKNSSESNLQNLNQFCEETSLELHKTLSLLELLKNEKLVDVEEIYDKIEGDENSPEKLIFKNFSIKVNNDDLSKLKPIYEPVKVIFDSKNCSGCGLCAGICPVNCLQIYNGFGKIDEDKCIRCGLCYFICPRTYLPVKVLNMALENTSEIKEYDKIGYFIEAYSAKTKIKEISEICQDGGISSTCLYYLFDKKKIDFALVAKMSNTLWRPGPRPLWQPNKDIPVLQQLFFSQFFSFRHHKGESFFKHCG